MKNYQRRASGGFPYFKLATWDAISMTWRDGKVQLASHDDAIAAAKKPGKYRVSTVTDAGRTDGEPFEVAAKNPSRI